MNPKRDELKFELIQALGVLSEKRSGWRKELNRVSWNGGEPKYDIREWDETHEKMGKGVTLTEEEFRRLKELVDEEIAFLDKAP